MILAGSRVRVRAGYEFVSCRRHGDQRLPAGPIATAKNKLWKAVCMHIYLQACAHMVAQPRLWIADFALHMYLAEVRMIVKNTSLIY